MNPLEGSICLRPGTICTEVAAGIIVSAHHASLVRELYPFPRTRRGGMPSPICSEVSGILMSFRPTNPLFIPASHSVVPSRSRLVRVHGTLFLVQMTEAICGAGTRTQATQASDHRTSFVCTRCFPATDVLGCRQQEE